MGQPKAVTIKCGFCRSQSIRIDVLFRRVQLTCLACGEIGQPSPAPSEKLKPVFHLAWVDDGAKLQQSNVRTP